MEEQSRISRNTAARDKAEGPHGKQTVRQLVRHSNGLKQVPVQGERLKQFERVLKKYGVDFAIMKETAAEKPRFLVFFKAKDESMISNVLQESTRKENASEMYKLL